MLASVSFPVGWTIRYQGVGQPKFSVGTHTAPDIPASLCIRQFRDLDSCCDFVHGRGGSMIGVEIVDGARSLDDDPFPFDKSCAFMMGNEGSGMSPQQKERCDSFCFISQYGCGTASLNVAVAASIVLHRCSAWRDTQRGQDHLQHHHQRTVGAQEGIGRA
ncbi:unnamed protein product [Choristocarpus tenellus]